MDSANHLIDGYCYNPKTDTWQRGIFPYPLSIYNRSSLDEEWKNHFLSVIGDTVFNNYIAHPAGLRGVFRTGGWWVHLRLCLTCGHVGCCDQSPNRHATRHFQDWERPSCAASSPARIGAGAMSTKSCSSPRRAGTDRARRPRPASSQKAHEPAGRADHGRRVLDMGHVGQSLERAQPRAPDQPRQPAADPRRGLIRIRRR